MKRLMLSLGVVAATMGVACGGAPETLDRTQPNYLRKSSLTDGTYYYLQTVVEVPSLSPMTFEGEQGDLEKVRFEVQENHLVAFRSYEYMPGTDPLVDPVNSKIGKTVNYDGSLYRGAPVAAWPIESHFDRQRQYNAATGEQSNVLEENTSDRPWYEREFIRVNWSQNKIKHYTLQPRGVQGDGAGFQDFVQENEANPGDYAFTTEYTDGDAKGSLNYLDFTVRQFWRAPTVDYPGYGKIPYCWLAPTVDCADAVVKVRNAFRRVDEAHVQDYEPLRYDDRSMTKFGYFRTERITYDRNRGATESGRILLANRHNIWERAHNEDGSVIPLERRRTKPVVYHLTPNFPEELLPSARGIESSWNEAFKRAVAVPRGVKTEEVEQMFYVCQTPVPANAPAACGPEGMTVRLGDLRYNVIGYVHEPQRVGLLGYGPSSADPETGEIVQAGAYMYGASLDAWVRTAQQSFELINGELSLGDIITGADARNFVAQNRQSTDPRPAGPYVSQTGLTAESAASSSYAKLRGTLNAQVKHFVEAGSPPVRKVDSRRVAEELIAKNPGLEQTMIDVAEVRSAVLANAPGDSYRQRLMTDPSLYRQVARQVMLRQNEIAEFNEQRLRQASEQNIWLAEFSDDALYGLAQHLKGFFDMKKAELIAGGASEDVAGKQARESVYVELRNLAFRSVAEHEVGHTVGLRHNFQGSFDAMNFQDGYWDLRKETIGVMAGGQRVMPFSPNDLMMASKLSENQKVGRLPELAYSSIMDYGARVTSQIHGLGKYDDAAILFAYSGTTEPGYVEVFKELRQDYKNPTSSVPTTNMSRPLKVRGAHVEIPLTHVEHFTPYSTMYSDRFHYTTLPFHFAEKGLGFEQALDQGIERMAKRGYRKYSDLRPYYETIQAALKKYNLDGRYYYNDDFGKSREVIQNVAAGMPVEVPYMFCSDSEVGANMTCYRQDYGADVYEMVSDWIQRYKDYYIFTSFKRDRYDFSPFSVYQSISARYIRNFPNIYHNWLFDVYFYQDAYKWTQEEVEESLGLGDPMYQNYFTMAVFDSLNLALGSLSTPAPGYYGKPQGQGHWVRLAENNTLSSQLDPGAESALIASVSGAGKPYQDVIYVPRSETSRPQYTRFQAEGYDFFTRPEEVGYFWDQYAFMQAVTASSTNFLGVDRGSDALRYSLPYYLVFNKELARTYQAVWTGDTDKIAASVAKTGDRLGTVIPPTLVNAADYVEGFVYPPARPLPVDSTGTPVAAEPIMSTPSWGTRWFSELHGMLFFTDNQNQEFATYQQIYRVGTSEEITPATGYSVAEFQDPIEFGGGYKYAAVYQTGLTSDELPASARLIEKANLAYSEYQALGAGAAKEAKLEEVREHVRSLELMRGIYNAISTVL